MNNWFESVSKQREETQKNNQENREEIPTEYVFSDKETAEEYLIWKKEVPGELRRLVEGKMKGREIADSPIGLPLTDQFLSCVRDQLLPIEQRKNTEEDPFAKKHIAPIGQIKTAKGYTDGFSALVDTNFSWLFKKQIYETQIMPTLEWLVKEDLKNIAQKTKKKLTNAGDKEGQKNQEEKPREKDSQEDTIPPDSEEMRSSMESGVEKSEGDPSAFFRINPFYGGYYRQGFYNIFNGNTLRWEKSENEFFEAQEENLDSLKKRMIAGKIEGYRKIALPLPYDWGVDKESFICDAPEGSVEIFRNKEGLCYLKINSEGIFNYQIKTGPRKFIQKEANFSETAIQGKIPQNIQKKIEEFKKENMPKAKLYREIVKFIRDHLEYSNSEEAWKLYANNRGNFFEEIWRKKEADCWVANTLAARALSDAGARVRAVGGFYVKEKNKQGEAILHNGNLHAWLEIWDEWAERPIRLDATPKGDPSLDSEAQERELEGESGEGDFGANEEELASEEEIKKQISNFKKEGIEAEKKKKKGPEYNLSEQIFAEQAECTPDQAREFLRALERVRKIKNEKGVPISNLLKEEWRKIARERKISISTYRGPVRMDEGDRLEDPVSAWIDIESKEFNPTGFEKDVEEEKTKTDFGGMNIYFSFDLSGSMNNPDPASGRRKADVQREDALLFIDSLMQCAVISRRSADKNDSLPFKIMAALAQNVGRKALELTDKWTPKEQWAIYSALIKCASGGTPTHETMELIEEEFKLEMAELERKKIPKNKMPVNYVVEITDGEPDDQEETDRMHALLESKGVIIGKYHIGKNVESFSKLPKILAEDIANLFKKLKPKQ